MIVKYTVVNDTNPTMLYAYFADEGEEEHWIRGIDLFNKIEIDGVEASISDIDSDEGNYQLSEGEHIIKYTLKDPTFIGLEIIDMSTYQMVGATFMRCTAISEVKIPNTVTTIGTNAFYNCTGLTSVIIPNSVTTIGDDAFADCSSLTSVTIGNSVTTIGDGAFLGCTSLTSVTIPNSVTTIGTGAFNGCTGLTSVTIGNGVTSINSSAFYGCTSLESITSMATTAPTIEFSAFQNIKTGGTLTVPSGSTGYDAWMESGNYYLGKYNWTKVEQ